MRDDPRTAGTPPDLLPARLEELARRCDESAELHETNGMPGWAEWLRTQAEGYRARRRFILSRETATDLKTPAGGLDAIERRKTATPGPVCEDER